MTRMLSLLAAGLLGGGVAAAALVASGATSSSSPTTIVRESAPATLAPAARTSTAPDAATIYARTAPGVVDITARSTQSGSSSGFPFGPSGGQQTVDTGAGFVIDTSGRILTAAHVVDGASSVTVRFADGTTRKATVLGKDRSNDVALLHVDPSGLRLSPLALGDSATLRVGDPVLAIGDPFGYDRSLSTGVVSGLGRSVEAPNGFSIANAVQTDAVLNPGNSGGPVLDASGAVIGIADQIVSGNQGGSFGTQQPSGNTGIGFLVPISAARADVGQLEQHGSVRHAYLGVATDSVNPNGGPVNGALIGSVQSGTPAAKAGLRQGDVIVSIDGRPLSDSTALVAAISAHRPGDTVKLGIRRGGRQLTVTVRLGEQPSQAPQTG